MNGLSNNLKISKDIVKDALSNAGIDPGIRGETLGLSEFGRISDELIKLL